MKEFFFLHGWEGNCIPKCRPVVFYVLYLQTSIFLAVEKCSDMQNGEVIRHVFFLNSK